MLRRIQGFSLFELLIAISIIATLWTFAAEPLNAFWTRRQIALLGSDWGAALSYTRMRAVQQRNDLTLCAIVSGIVNRCRRDNQWADGWIIFTDSNKNWIVDADETLLVQHDLSLTKRGLSMTSNTLINPFGIRFNALGISTTKATLSIRTSSGPKRYICISNGANVRMGDTSKC